MNTPSFSVVLVNYKTPEITRICLELLREPAQRLGFPVWVVDNDSADASTEYLRSLDWIRLLERKPAAGEPGFMAHGHALDMVLERTTTDYLFLLHTDTFVYDPTIFDIMLHECERQDAIAAGCVDQIPRSWLHANLRFLARYIKHQFRRLKLAVGIKTRPPRPYREEYLNSFCSLWRLAPLKEHNWTFAMDGKIPSYAIQDRLAAAGYKVARISAHTIFRYLDHMEAGTVAAGGGYHANHPRTKRYLAMLDKHRSKVDAGRGQ